MVVGVVWARGPKISFHIPAGDAQQTLLQYSSQSQIGLLGLTETLRGVTTNPVEGSLDASDALAQLLMGTGLEYEFDDDYSSVAITRSSTVSVAHGVQAPTFERTSDSSSGREVSDGDVRSSEVVTKGDSPIEVVVTGTLIHGVIDIVPPSRK